MGGGGPDKDHSIGMAQFGAGSEPPRWGVREWLFLALALVPLVALVVLALVLRS